MLNILRESSLNQLRANLSGNLERYRDDESWVEEYFDASNWRMETPIDLPSGFELLLPTAEDTFDLENTKRIYLAFPRLSPTQAADERLWAYLSHVVCWKYMRARWNVANYSGSRPVEYVRDRYFFMPNRDRALVRNGIARLWTYAHVTFDEHRDDPFELTGVLLQKLDIAQQLLERTFSRAPNVTRAVLSYIHAHPGQNIDLTDREHFRDLMRHVNRVGGVTILDLLEQEDLLSIISDRVALLESKAA